MPDWKLLVRQQMGETSLAPAQMEEIVSELASHFEEVFDEARARGASEMEAFNHALSEVSNWQEFAQQINRAKQEEEIMNDRTKRFWLPGFISAASASVFLMILAKVSYEPRVILWRSSLMIMVYPIWLVGQPLFGALGAFFSRRAGGTRWARVLAGLFPSLLLAAGMLVVILIQALTPGKFDLGSMDWVMLARSIFAGVVVPSVGLLLGALPFLREAKIQHLAGN
jgi:hypothetical protein